jgi:hypothetical protein
VNTRVAEKQAQSCRDNDRVITGQRKIMEGIIPEYQPPEVLVLYLERPPRNSAQLESLQGALRIQRLEGSRPPRKPMYFESV